ncbi:MAG TPA: SUMF1/EgtB/PvdO family nonheme iron enzyme [Thermoanaerobaculia bacterium]|nr:SUMF1/EgtB/PvdO family nonheme iron enzyme [Thermoanaerobaculia bacterium]
MRHHAFPNGVTNAGLVEWYRATRARTRTLFDLVTPEAYYDRPIALRNPIVFYEGHLPGFSVNTLIKLTLQRPGVDERLETLFARGIDPADESAVRSPTDVWPSREEVQVFAAACDALVEAALAETPIGEASFTIIEHELMHQETLLYMLHNLPYEKKQSSSLQVAKSSRGFSPARSIAIPAGRATLGTSREFFGWDNEFPAHVVDVPAFEIDAYPVTNGQYLEYIDATGAPGPHFWDGTSRWRGMFSLQPLMLDAPVWVTHDEASAYAKWRGKRLPSEAEFQRAAEGVKGGEYGFQSFDPVAVDAHPEGVSAWGVHDLVGNGWEWTSTLFDGFPGFKPMASYKEYSADFFDNAHYVLKGASPVTDSALIRPGFRNWFRPNYPYVFAKFRCASCT